MISQVLRTKLIAVLIGPSGLGIISQLQSVFSLIFAVIPFGTVGITRYFSEFYEQRNFRLISSLLKSLFLKNIFVIFGLITAILLFGDSISTLLFGENSYHLLLIIFSLALPVGLLFSFLEIYLKSIRKIKLFVKYSIVSTSISLVITIPTIYFWGLWGAAFTFLITSLISLIIGVYFLKISGSLPIFDFSEKIEKSISKGILKIGTASAIMLATQNISLLMIKSSIAAHFGVDAVGIYQSVFSISNNYFGLFFGVIGIYSLPKLSTIKDKREIVLEVNRALKLVLLIYIPVICVSFIFRDIVIALLYSNEFIAAQDLFLFQLLGDFFKSMSWIFGLWLVPNMKIKEWFIFDISATLMFLLLFNLLLKGFGLHLNSATISYFISFLIIAIVQFFYIRKSLQFTFEMRNSRALVASIVCLSVVMGVSQYNILLGYLVSFPLLAIWSYLVVQKADVEKFLKLILKKTSKGNYN